MKECASGYGLIEGPVWHGALGLLFSDVPNGGVYRLAKDGSVTQQVPKRRGIGGMALHADGGLVMGGRDIVVTDIDGTNSGTLLAGADTRAGVGFNDLTTDAAGRIYVGCLGFRVFGGGEPKPGYLHVIDLDGSTREISDGIMLTNGLGFSPDGKRLYHSDARADVVRVYDVLPDGSVSGWQPFARIQKGETPDGLAVAADGSVWVALAHGGAVAVYEPDGALRERVAVPLPMVTSVCFGGDDLRDLYVVTGSRGGPSENCGTVFVMRAPVAGLPLEPARVRRPAS
jgi:xylono-1,5-lactonase